MAKNYQAESRTGSSSTDMGSDKYTSESQNCGKNSSQNSAKNSAKNSSRNSAKNSSKNSSKSKAEDTWDADPK